MKREILNYNKLKSAFEKKWFPKEWKPLSEYEQINF